MLLCYLGFCFGDLVGFDLWVFGYCLGFGFGFYFLVVGFADLLVGFLLCGVCGLVLCLI